MSLMVKIQNEPSMSFYTAQLLGKNVGFFEKIGDIFGLITSIIQRNILMMLFTRCHGIIYIMKFLPSGNPEEKITVLALNKNGIKNKINAKLTPITDITSYEN